jgi:hypothetical protein
MSTLMRRMRSPCCARAANGHVVAPPSSDMNARRNSITSSARASSVGGTSMPSVAPSQRGPVLLLESILLILVVKIVLQHIQG